MIIYNRTVYNKDPILNKILSDNFMPFDYNRKINEKLLKTIKGFKQGKIKILDEYIFLNSSGNVTKTGRATIFIRVADFL